MRLIDADAIPYTMLYKENWMGCTGIEKRGVWKDTIDTMPTIEERKKGKWIVIEYPDIYVCPFCKHASSKKNFCGTCGADLKGEQDERV